MISYHIYYVVLNKTFKYSAWEYEVMRSLTSSQETALLKSLSDLSRPWESPDRIYEEGLDIGWLTSSGYGGKVFVKPKDRLENKFRDLVWMPRLGFCPLTEHNPGL